MADQNLRKTKAIEIKSPIPYYACAGVWVIWALFRPMYRVQDFLLVIALSAVVFLFLKKKIAPKVTLVPVEEEPVATGDQTADSIIAAGRACLSRIQRAALGVDDVGVKEKMRKLVELCGKIFDFIAANPAKASEITKLTEYYLPMVEKMLLAYEDMEDQKIDGQNIRSAMERIDSVLDTVCQAFTRQLDALYEGTALNIAVDVRVLESMLAQQGLSGGMHDQSGR